MSNLNKANNLASEWVESMGGLEAIRHDHGSDLSGLMQALDDAGLLAPDLPEPDSHDEETGRGGAVDVRDSLYESPYEWVRNYAERMGETNG